jgi:hypothetical protein
MTLDELRGSLAAPEPPARIGAPLTALWHDAHGDWARAHEVVMNAKGRDAAWVHAYLHRKEGDLPNARYWYRAARQPEFDGTLEAEWAAIAAVLLETDVR